MLLGATCAPLDHCFILFLIKFFNTSFKKTLKIFNFLKYYYVKVYIKKIPKYVIKTYFQIVLMEILNNGYKRLKVFIGIFHSLD